MKIENLRSLIKESIQEYISEVEESGNIAAQEAKVRACDEAIANRMKKINMEGLDEAYHDMMSEEKMKELKSEVKALENYKKKATKILEKLLEKKENKGKPKAKKEEEDVVTDAVTEDAPIDETDVRAEMELEETAINESFLKMQKLAGVITEAQYNQKKSLIEAKANDSVKGLLKAKLKNDAELVGLIKKLDDAHDEDHYLSSTGQMSSKYGNNADIEKYRKDIMDHVKKVMGMNNLEADIEDIINAIK